MAEVPTYVSFFGVMGATAAMVFSCKGLAFLSILSSQFISERFFHNIFNNFHFSTKWDHF